MMEDDDLLDIDPEEYRIAKAAHNIVVEYLRAEAAKYNEAAQQPPQNPLVDDTYWGWGC